MIPWRPALRALLLPRYLILWALLAIIVVTLAWRERRKGGIVIAARRVAGDVVLSIHNDSKETVHLADVEFHLGELSTYTKSISTPSGFDGILRPGASVQITASTEYAHLYPSCYVYLTPWSAKEAEDAVFQYSTLPWPLMDILTFKYDPHNSGYRHKVDLP